MSSDETPNVSTPRHSREAVREKAQKVHAKQSRARVVRVMIIALVAVLFVGAAGGAVAWTVGSALNKPELQPSNMSGDGVVVHDLSSAAQTTDGSAATPPALVAEQMAETPTATGAPGAVSINVYVDFLSPRAGEFEQTNASQLKTWSDQDAATVTYHPVALLTANSNGTKYSLRAAAAAACVATYAPDAFYPFTHELLVNQPALDSDGKSDTQLADLAQAAGVEDVKKTRSCIEDKDYVGWAKDATARALEGPLPGSTGLTLNGAPTIVVNGQAYGGALDDPVEFSQFVFSVANDAYNSTPTPTATPAP